MIKPLAAILKPYQGLSKETWWTLFAGFINAMALMVAIYISLYLNALHYSIHAIGIVLTFYGFFSVVGAYVGGLITDRLDPLVACKLSLLSSSILFFAFPFLKSYLFILLVAGLMSFSASIFRPAFILLLTVGETTQPLEKIAALRRVAMNLGMALGTGICGFLAAKKFSYVFFFDAATILFALVLLFNIQHAKYSSDNKNKTNEGEKVMMQGFIVNLLLIFLFVLIFYQTLATYPIFLINNVHLNETNISLLFTFSGVLIAFFQVPLIHYLQTVNSYLLCMLGAFLIGLGFFMLPWSHTLISVTLSCIFWTFGEMIFFPTHLAIVLRLAGNRKGKSMGYYQMVFSSATFLAPALGTTVYAYRQNLLWYICGALSLIAILIAGWLLKNSSIQQDILS